MLNLYQGHDEYIWHIVISMYIVVVRYLVNTELSPIAITNVDMLQMNHDHFNGGMV